MTKSDQVAPERLTLNEAAALTGLTLRALRREVSAARLVGPLPAVVNSSQAGYLLCVSRRTVADLIRSGSVRVERIPKPNKFNSDAFVFRIQTAEIVEYAKRRNTTVIKSFETSDQSK